MHNSPAYAQVCLSWMVMSEDMSNNSRILRPKPILPINLHQLLPPTTHHLPSLPLLCHQAMLPRQEHRQRLKVRPSAPNAVARYAQIRSTAAIVDQKCSKRASNCPIPLPPAVIHLTPRRDQLIVS